MVDRLIPVREAAQEFGVSEESLLKLIDQGAIKAVMLPGGEVALASEVTEIVLLNARLLDVKRIHFDYLRDSLITVVDAEKKYNVPNTTIRTWLRNAYIRIASEQYPIFLNESDMAYCARIYHERKSSKTQSGVPLLDELGFPNLLKSPYQSEYRKRKSSRE